jgi:hypothetical protein
MYVRTHGQRLKQTPKTTKTPIRASTLINQLRAVLLERGIVVAKRRRRLEEHLKLMLAEDAEPPATLSGCVAGIGGAGALTPTRSGFRPCGRTSGVPAPAYG